MSNDFRTVQARRLFDLGFADVLGCTGFEQYLNATGKDSLEPVPMVPTFPEPHVRLFGPQGIWLVDGRVAAKVGFKEYLRIIGLGTNAENDRFEAFDPKRAKSGIRWMIGQDGYRNRCRTPDDCRKTFAPFEVGMDWVEGASVYALDPKVIEGHYLNLPGSVFGVFRHVACLGVFSSKPKLDWFRSDGAALDRGTASRGE